MKRKELWKALDEISDEKIAEAADGKPKAARRRARWIGPVAAVLALALTLGLFFGRGVGTTDVSACAIFEAEYPEQPGMPGGDGYGGNQWDLWSSAQQERMAQGEGLAQELAPYFSASISQFLGGGGDENQAFSPVNIYMALALTAETADGESREQILGALGVEDVAALREQACRLWNASYKDDGMSRTILANSLWLDEDISYREDTLKTLAEEYRASSFRGQMGSEELNSLLRAWLSEQTGGLLDQEAQGMELSPETVMALASTIYFQARWGHEFMESDTREEIFHSAGGDISCDFMHSSNMGNYFRGKNCEGVRLHFTDGGRMVFILPEEGVTPGELLERGEVTESLLSGQWEDEAFILIRLSLPKFDISQEQDLVQGLEAMGITDVFDPKKADFSTLTGDTKAYLSEAQHAARVAIDEEGCTAAAFTVMVGDGAGMPEDEVELTFDRPFLFAVMSDCDLPLFVGIVNQP